MKSLAKYCLGNSTAKQYIFGCAFVLLALLLGVMLGSSPLTLDEIVHGLQNGFNSSAGGRIFGYVRLPRTLAALVTGAALSVSGAVIQGVLANRLASPGVIGVNAGAGLAVTVCAALGIVGGWQLSLFSFAGAFAAVMLVSLGARRWGASRGTVILMGVALNSILGALSDTVITLVPEAAIMSSGFKVGEFSYVTYPKLIPAACIIVVSILILLTLSNELELLALGDETASGLGLDAARMRMLFLLLAALLAGSAVSLAGLLSFVGLLVPHAVRRITRSGSRGLIGLCALYGAGFVCLSDTVARTAFAPYELPVGIIMAYLGAPFFLFLIIRRKGGHGND